MHMHNTPTKGTQIGKDQQKENERSKGRIPAGECIRESQQGESRCSARLRRLSKCCSAEGVSAQDSFKEAYKKPMD
jgi:hypothetical protein